MKLTKMWVLVNKKTGRLVAIGIPGFCTDPVLVVGFARKKDLLVAIGTPERDEQIKKVEVET